MNIFLLFLFFILMIIHRFLTVFWEQGNLPYNFGFVLFCQVYFFAVFIFSIHLFGWILGIIVFLLFMFQVVYFVYAKIFLFLLLKIYSKNNIEIVKFKPVLKYNKFTCVVQCVWSNLVPIFLILVIISLFTTDYLYGQSLLNKIGLKPFFIFTICYFIITNLLITILNKDIDAKMFS